MLVHFHLHFRTQLDESIGIEYRLNGDDAIITLLFQTYDGENWVGDLEMDASNDISYKYLIIKNNTDKHYEWGKLREIKPIQKDKIFIQDHWRSRANENNIFLSSAFTKSIFKRKITPSKKDKRGLNKNNQLEFRLQCAQIPSHLRFGITGNIEHLGSWETPILLEDLSFPSWKTTIEIFTENVQIEYKYIIYDPKTKAIVEWEEGENRKLTFVFPNKTNNLLVLSDDEFRHKNSRWKGSGVAIPVFSLRSNHGLGIGEFNDLIGMVDWIKKIGMNVIQVLPINDTIANKSWLDSYPYAAISVFALNPLYINLRGIGKLKRKEDQQKLAHETVYLNSLEQVDFEAVLKTKFDFFRILFDQEYNTFKEDKEFLEFFRINALWLKQYAVFCHLRDKNNTCDFSKWKEHAVFSENIMNTLCNHNYADIKDIEFYFFLQYHADKQLLAVKEYARENAVVLKGDLPIGIYRYSCDAWVAPELYNISEQAGAPPDDYAVLGQNWGFPTYNWEVMAKNGFEWWKDRMQALNRYFDALRIDHILGFFRIWQIPMDQIEGTMGLFNPRKPYSLEELSSFGLYGDLSRFTLPYLTDIQVQECFGNEFESLRDVFFETDSLGKIKFKPTLNTQKTIKDFIDKTESLSKYKKSLFNLLSEVLLIEEPNSNSLYFNPRITLSTTNSFRSLDQHRQNIFTNLYNDYYYHRHDEFWKVQALSKLPALLDASEMLICGEDLGMIPNSVPSVMKDMNIISLEIQRMPKGNHRFGQVSDYPYFSVCSPSCHDMSTIRGWWEADHENAKEFYYNYLGFNGLTPMKCSLEIVEAIVDDHLSSPSLFAIFPVQDLIALDSELSKEDVFSEQINEPSNPKHYWRYRCHLSTEDLLNASFLNQKIRSLVHKHR